VNGRAIGTTDPTDDGSSGSTRMDRINTDLIGGHAGFPS